MDNVRNLELTLETFRENLDRDRVHLQRSVSSLMSRTPTPTVVREYLQKRSDSILDEVKPTSIEDARCPLGTPDLDEEEAMLGTRSRVPESFRAGGGGGGGGRRVMGGGPAPLPPKYGLPGLGQYDERRRRYQEEWKRDYADYVLQQNATKPRRRANNSNGALDYEEMLAHKRYQENNYRQQNDPSYNTGLMRPAKSDSYLHKADTPEFDHRLVPSLDLQPDGANGVQYNAQIGNGYSDFSNGYNARPHSYPTEGNPNFDGYLPAAPYSNAGNDVYNSGRRHSATGLSMAVPITIANGFSGGIAYQADLEKQMEETRRRRQNEKAEQLRTDKKLEEDNRNYDPWGRGGAGAPRRDNDGNVIAVRKQLGNGQPRRNRPDIPPVVTATDKSTPTQPNYAIPRSPLHGAGAGGTAAMGPTGRRGAGDARQTLANYQDDLKRQIEEKKQRDLAEKERERQEDERLARKIREDNERMQREHESEVKKQQQREQERARRNEELQKRLEDQRKESKKKKREDRDQGQRRPTRDGEAGPAPRDKGERTRSPPLPTVKSRERVVERKNTVANHKPVAANLPAALQPTKPVPKKSSTESIDPSKEQILSQLATMRQQLEKEQQMMHLQLRQQMENSYAVLDGRSKKEGGERRTTDQPKDRNGTTNPQRPSIYQQVVQPEANHDRQMTQRYSSENKHSGNSSNTASRPALKEVFYRAPNDPGGGTGRTHNRWPAVAATLRATTIPAKPLEGESLFLGMENYAESSPTSSTGESRGSWQKHEDRRPKLDDYPYDSRQLENHQATRQKYTNPRNGSNRDDIQEDSFLDEYMARNLPR